MRQIENLQKKCYNNNNKRGKNTKVESRKAILSVQINWLEFILADEWLRYALYNDALKIKIGCEYGLDRMYGDKLML